MHRYLLHPFLRECIAKRQILEPQIVRIIEEQFGRTLAVILLRTIVHRETGMFRSNVGSWIFWIFRIIEIVVVCNLLRQCEVASGRISIEPHISPIALRSAGAVPEH